DVGEVLDRRHDPVHLLPREAEQRAVEVRVLTPAEVGMEAGADLEEGRDATVHLERSGGRLRRAGEELEERRLPGAVRADDAERVRRVDAGRDDVHVLKARGADTISPGRSAEIAFVDALGEVLVAGHAPSLGPPVERHLARDDVRVEEAAGPEDARHLREHRGRLAEVLEKTAGEDDVERPVRERERPGVPEQGIAGKLRATIVLAHGPDGIRRVVDGDEAVGPLAPEPDEEAARAGADLDRVATGREMPPQMRDLRLVYEVEDVAARWIEELRVADRPLPCGRVAFGVARFVLVMGVTQKRKATCRGEHA